MLGFSLIIAPHIPVNPIISIIKLAKLWIHLENLAHIQRKSVYSIETLCSLPNILLSNLGGVRIFKYLRYFLLNNLTLGI